MWRPAPCRCCRGGEIEDQPGALLPAKAARMYSEHIEYTGVAWESSRAGLRESLVKTLLDDCPWPCKHGHASMAMLAISSGERKR